ncbi:DUF4124 domain-containing protein [Nitrococcus mobilis]|uniref:DUF4124 domain-containing protein n=1 Tax=Nitrococcus mobilis Nb-231 TaxID=314278 RepID=A4BTX1_9GAMM|nr:DUF4124 domain-containing protein [Nitrococcus mobilis]EAR20792.1 hypothetical protein NB231_10964 [Nitrococcus mobilis Nb-231]
MKRITASAVLFLLAALPVGAVVYKWTDEEGGVHFSDNPHPGAKRLDLEQPPAVSLPPVEEAPSTAPQTSLVTKGYAQFGIAQPQAEATVRNNPGTVIVRFRIEPELRDGDRIRVSLDGQPVDAAALSGAAVELHEIVRGTHTLGAVIEDAMGGVVARADPVTFYMHRPSVNIPANKPPRLP